MPNLITHSGKEKEMRRAKYNRTAAANKISKIKSSNMSDLAKTIRIDDIKYKADQRKKHSFSHFKTHSGLSTSVDSLRELSQAQGMDLPDEIFSKIEGFTLLCAALIECRSYTQALSIFMLYLKSHYSESLIIKGSEAFKALFQEDEIVSHSSKPEWIEILRDATTNWRMVVTNPVFKKLSSLISICITLGLCDATSFEWKMGNVKVFSIGACERHFGAVDLIDAAIETVSYFVEGGYQCFVSGSLRPLLYTDVRAREFEENYTMLVSNLEHVRTGNLKKLANMDDNAYAFLLSNTLDEVDALYDSAKGTWEKKLFFDRRAALRKLKTTFDAIRVQGGIRVAPFTVNIFGKSGVGKSTLATITMIVGLKSNGYGAEDELLCTLNESDKFMSNYRSYINGIFIDDIGNTKPDFVEKAPTNKIIEICNNVRQYANMAEADLKGKVSIEPLLVVLTTNIKTLNAGTYSVEPVSISRRAHITVTCKVKPEFCSTGMAGSVGQQLDSAKVEAFYTDEDGVIDIPVIPDLWDLTVERVVPIPQPTSCDQTMFEVYEHKGKKLENCSILDYLDFMIDLSRDHYAQQERLVERTNNLHTKVDMCGTCKRPSPLCQCAKIQSGYLLGAAIGHLANSKFRKLKNKVTDSFIKETGILETMATKQLLRFTSTFENSPFFMWTNWVPTPWLVHRYGRAFVEYAMRDDIIQNIRSEVINTFVAIFALICWGCYAPLMIVFILPIVLWLLYRYTIIVATVRERMYATICERNDSMPLVFKQVRDKHMKYVGALLGATFALYTLLKIWQGFRNSVLKPNGNLNPRGMEDIAARDAEVNPWVNHEVEPLPKNSSQMTLVPSELGNKVKKNLIFLKIKQDNNWRTSNAIVLSSGVLLMPYHMWFRDGVISGQPEAELQVQFVVTEQHKSSPRPAILVWDHSVRVSNLDFVMTWCPNLGTHASLVNYLAVEKIRPGVIDMYYRRADGTTHDAYGHISPGYVGHNQLQFPGATYNLNINTFCGLCMAPLIMGGGGATIVGFHLGGKTNSPTGVSGTLLLPEAVEFLQKLAAKPGVLLPFSEGTMQSELYGKNFLTASDVHYKSPVNFLENSNIRVFGSTIGRATAHSDVVTTVISDSVAAVCGVPQKWGPPQFAPRDSQGRTERWKPWQATLEYSANPSVGVPGNLIAKAVIDYQRPLLDLLADKQLAETIRPLTRMEVLTGKDGVRFIDKMSAKTSVGFPLCGPKSQYLTILDPADFPDVTFPVELDQQFWDEYERVEQVYLSGERAYPVFKACLKDEPTSLDKEKVRVFQSAPLVLQLFIRRYYLPIARLLSLYPLLSECAVGLNAQGPEWEQFQAHITKYGKDRILAGDYSKYDLRMPVQCTLSAFSILITIAEATGNYSPGDLAIMRGIATDVCYPVMAYDGTLIQLIGSNPSGQNLTVYINSIVNSLLVRAGFYSIYPNTTLGFRDVCAIGTYGDDVKGSVKINYDEFNHITFADFLAKYDMKFTMPDKESTPVPYMRDEDADFLKRKNVYNPEVKMHFGALDENSIFKSLHATLRSTAISPRELATGNIDGALREWFAHGRDIYEMRRTQMAQIAQEHKLPCTEIHLDYDSQLAKWKTKYLEPQSGLQRMTKLERQTNANFEHVINNIPHTLVAREAPILLHVIAEVDLVFRAHSFHQHFIYVEIKNSKHNRAKGHDQIKKIVRAMGIMSPNHTHIGVYWDPCGFQCVSMSGRPDRLDWDPLPFEKPSWRGR
jgi:hypothetical protein